MLKQIINQYPAVPAHMDGLPTWRALPHFGLAHLDPFIFINHHGPTVFSPHNQGLPFGPHPHRGFETLTFVLDGEVMHRDTSGGKSIIHKDGVQWMTAGRGIIHSEESSDTFKELGGNMHIIQIWMNLPSSLKMTEPTYQGFEADDLIHIPIENNKGILHLISGVYDSNNGPAKSITNLFVAWLDIKAGGKFSMHIPKDHNTMLYLVNGNLLVNNTEAAGHSLLHLDKEAGEIEITAMEDSIILLGHGMPYNEPIVAQGSFVMNTDTQILEAMRDYRMGKMGFWVEP